MQELADMESSPYHDGVRALTVSEVDEFLPQVPAWQIARCEGVDCLKRVFKFKDFGAALAFANEVGELAEAENHHPVIQVEWGRAAVTWWTHKVNGLHRNDFIMAAKTDCLYAWK